MSREIWAFAATIPAGTPQAAPVVVPVATPPRTVESIRWRVPHGPMGLMGWQLSMGGVQVLPTPGTPWVIANGEWDTWQVNDMPNSGAWQVTGYNTGIYPHTVYVEFRLNPIAAPVVLLPLLTPAQLAPVPDLAAAGAPIRVQPWPS